MKNILLTLSMLLLVSCSSGDGSDGTAGTDDATDDNVVTVDPADVGGTDVGVEGDGSAGDDDSGAGDDDSAVDTGTGGSSIHGGSPTPVTWSDCSQWPGDNPCNFSLVDQYGDTFELYDNYGTVMVLDFSTMWCGVCRSLADDVQGYQDAYGDQDFLWVTVIVETATAEEPAESDIQDWATTYGIVDSPVLAGNRTDFVDLTGITGYPISAWPTFVVIDREMILTNGLNGWNESVVLGWVDDAL